MESGNSDFSAWNVLDPQRKPLSHTQVMSPGVTLVQRCRLIALLYATGHCTSGYEKGKMKKVTKAYFSLHSLLGKGNFTSNF